MSGLIVGLVIRTPISDDFVSTAKYVAIIYADHAWEDGTHAYPAIETVATAMGVDTRTVQRHLRDLEQLGMLVSDGKGPRGTNRYKFPLVEGTDGSVRLDLKGGGTAPPRQIARGDTDSGDTDSGDTHWVTPMSPKSFNQPSDLIVVVNADFGEICKAYEQEFGALTPMIADAIRDAENTYPPDWIPEAMAIAVKNNARNWKYVEAVLKNCKARNMRPSLNAKERKNATNTRTGNPRRTGQEQASAVYTDADRAAAAAINQR